MDEGSQHHEGSQHREGSQHHERRGPVPGKAGRHARAEELGRAGEECARRYLEDRGIVVLARNWRCRDGELDIVATDGATLIVCEVKTRSGLGFGTPSESISAEKVARIRRVASQWMCSVRLRGVPVRFDVCSVLWPSGDQPRIEHIEGAF